MNAISVGRKVWPAGVTAPAAGHWWPVWPVGSQASRVDASRRVGRLVRSPRGGRRWPTNVLLQEFRSWCLGTATGSCSDVGGRSPRISRTTDTSRYCRDGENEAANLGVVVARISGRRAPLKEIGEHLVGGKEWRLPGQGRG